MQKLVDYMSSRPALQDKIKEVIHVEKNDTHAPILVSKYDSAIKGTKAL